MTVGETKEYVDPFWDDNVWVVDYSLFRPPKFAHSLPFATVKADEISGSQPAEVLNLGNWTKYSNWNTIPDPLNDEPFIKVSEGDEKGIQLYFPYKDPFFRYLMLGYVTTSAAHRLSLLEVSEFFANLIQRVSPKIYQQAFAEVYVTQKFLENFCGDQVHFLARSFAVSGNHLGHQSHGFRWTYAQ
ncbi:probable aldehyde dehydrogenase [Phtheirospermum japonicum]|uniref:Probable aldehyde dehydrogenase n=1 Tax=Phtheirospermum japonicum TaxID=374723 RepID=A0A830CYV6_9LAMI|nr:probable aldehyde dehydrogenase [Phtheirospermum japonicum]